MPAVVASFLRPPTCSSAPWTDPGLKSPGALIGLVGPRRLYRCTGEVEAGCWRILDDTTGGGETSLLPAAGPSLLALIAVAR
jgi:hypothetical protein